MTLKRLPPVQALLLSALCLSLLPSPAGADLSSDISALLNAPQLRGGIDGVMVSDVRTGKILFARNPDTLLVPASNRKLFTAAAALDLMGPDRQEETDLLASAPADADGTIDGSLYLRGGGDPLLSVDDLGRMAATLAARGVRHVTGGIDADSTLIAGSPWGDGWQIDSLLDYYSPEIDALEVNEGIASIALHGGAKVGDPTTFTIDPQTSYFTVEDDATTGAPGSGVEIDRYRTLTSTHFVYSGSIPVNASPDPNDDDTDGRITVPDPPLYAATILAEKLSADGIVVDGPVELGATPPGAALLVSHKSLPLSKMLAKMLKPSDNLIAEILTRLEAARPDHPGTYDEGAQVEDRYFKTLGIGADDHSFVDGSGVSRINFVTPRAEMTLLLAMAKRPDFPIFYNALSIAGVNGTAADRFRGTPVAGNAHVKTGTVRHCRSLSGYVTDRSGRLLAFVILMNNHLISAHAMGAVQDKILERIAAER